MQTGIYPPMPNSHVRIVSWTFLTIVFCWGELAFHFQTMSLIQLVYLQICFLVFFGLLLQLQTGQKQLLFQYTRLASAETTRLHEISIYLHIIIYIIWYIKMFICHTVCKCWLCTRNMYLWSLNIHFFSYGKTLTKQH